MVNNLIIERDAITRKLHEKDKELAGLNEMLLALLDQNQTLELNAANKDNLSSLVATHQHELEQAELRF